MSKPDSLGPFALGRARHPAGKVKAPKGYRG